LVIITEYDIGDLVNCGPIEGNVIGVKYFSGLIYDINYWDDNKSTVYSAYSWELKLLQKGNIDDRDNNKNK